MEETIYSFYLGIHYTQLPYFHICVKFPLEHHVEFDNLCSIGWCEMITYANILYGMIYIVDTLSISAHMFSVLKVYIFLTNQTRSGNLKSTKNYSVHGVTSKLFLSMFLEIIFRLYLFTLITFKMYNSYQKYFCLYLFMYVLPLNLFFPSCGHCRK